MTSTTIAVFCGSRHATPDIETAAKAKLGEKRIRVGLLNVGGYYDPLIALRNNAHVAGLIHPHAKSIVKIDNDLNRLLDTLLKPF